MHLGITYILNWSSFSFRCEKIVYVFIYHTDFTLQLFEKTLPYHIHLEDFFSVITLCGLYAFTPTIF